MQSVCIEPNIRAWRQRARDFLAKGTPPETLLWEDGSLGAGSLFDEGAPAGSERREGEPAVRALREFFALAELVACHRDPERWGMLYRVAYRLTHGGEGHLLKVRTDDDVRRLETWASEVSRDRHKMKAFVRFKKVGETEGGREQFAAWFEPDNDIIELTAPFFAKRFAGMDWSILTPCKCAHWDGEQLSFSPGVARENALKEDRLEDYWRSYYAHIFNPARLKLKAMQSEMPKKYWKNLPEAPLIAELTSGASNRAIRMVDAPDSQRAHVTDRIPKGVPQRTSAPSQVIDPAEALQRAEALSLDDLRTAAAHCQSCDLCERATRTVFGAGSSEAEVMIVGEQPGDVEDLVGRPFAGPVGELLDQALEEVGIEREAIYLTNSVKHFKWKRQGKTRLHQTPSAGEVEKCKPWLLAEILKIQPRAIICLGSTAARALVRPDFAIVAERGLVPDCNHAETVVATLHPSYLLRLRNASERELEYRRWTADLRLVLPAN